MTEAAPLRERGRPPRDALVRGQAETRDDALELFGGVRERLRGVGDLLRRSGGLLRRRRDLLGRRPRSCSATVGRPRRCRPAPSSAPAEICVDDRRRSRPTRPLMSSTVAPIALERVARLLDGRRARGRCARRCARRPRRRHAVSRWISSTRPEIWPAALCDSSASLRTSSATTAKPLPCSPARAASMAALSASRFVCSAIAGDRGRRCRRSRRTSPPSCWIALDDLARRRAQRRASRRWPRRRRATPASADGAGLVGGRTRLAGRAGRLDDAGAHLVHGDPRVGSTERTCALGALRRSRRWRARSRRPRVPSPAPSRAICWEAAATVVAEPATSPIADRRPTVMFVQRMAERVALRARLDVGGQVALRRSDRRRRRCSRRYSTISSKARAGVTDLVVGGQRDVLLDVALGDAHGPP